MDTIFVVQVVKDYPVLAVFIFCPPEPDALSRQGEADRLSVFIKFDIEIELQLIPFRIETRTSYFAPDQGYIIDFARSPVLLTGVMDHARQRGTVPFGFTKYRRGGQHFHGKTG